MQRTAPLIKWDVTWALVSPSYTPSSSSSVASKSASAYRPVTRRARQRTQHGGAVRTASGLAELLEVCIRDVGLGATVTEGRGGQPG